MNTESEATYNAGLEAAADHLRAKARKMRDKAVGPTPTANLMANIFEGEAAEILALRRHATIGR